MRFAIITLPPKSGCTVVPLALLFELRVELAERCGERAGGEYGQRRRVCRATATGAAKIAHMAKTSLVSLPFINPSDQQRSLFCICLLNHGIL